MKIKLNNVEIELTDEQVKQITEASKPKLFEYDKGNTFLVSNTSISNKNNGNDNDFKKYGKYRRTKEQAEMDFKRQTRMMRLSALAWEVGEVKEFVKCESNFYILNYGDKWIIELADMHYSPERVYMTKETAIEVCKMLNSGEYSLDVE